MAIAHAPVTSDAPSSLFHVLHDLMSAQSISCNALLWFLIIRHTPPHLKSYSVMLLFTSTYELISAMTGFFLFPRIISLGNEALILVVYGPCAFFEKNGCLLYVLRYFVIRHPTPPVKSTVQFNIIIAIPTAICFILFNFGRSPLEEALPLFEKHVPQYNLSGTRLEVMLDPIHTPAIATTLWVCTTALPCLCINVYSGTSIHRFLNNKASHLAERTKTLHRQLLKALICQCLISQVFMIAVTCFVLGHFNIIKHPALEYGVHCLGDACIGFSPLTTLYFVTPYRMKVRELLNRRRRQKKVVDVTASMDMTRNSHVLVEI